MLYISFAIGFANGKKHIQIGSTVDEREVTDVVVLQIGEKFKFSFICSGSSNYATVYFTHETKVEDSEMMIGFLPADENVRMFGNLKISSIRTPHPHTGKSKHIVTVESEIQQVDRIKFMYVGCHKRAEKARLGSRWVRDTQNVGRHKTEENSVILVITIDPNVDCSTSRFSRQHFDTQCYMRTSYYSEVSAIVCEDAEKTPLTVEYRKQRFCEKSAQLEMDIYSKTELSSVKCKIAFGFTNVKPKVRLDFEFPVKTIEITESDVTSLTPIILNNKRKLIMVERSFLCLKSDAPMRCYESDEKIKFIGTFSPYEKHNYDTCFNKHTIYNVSSDSFANSQSIKIVGNTQKFSFCLCGNKLAENYAVPDDKDDNVPAYTAVYRDECNTDSRSIKCEVHFSISTSIKKTKCKIQDGSAISFNDIKTIPIDAGKIKIFMFQIISRRSVSKLTCDFEIELYGKTDTITLEFDVTPIVVLPAVVVV